MAKKIIQTDKELVALIEFGNRRAENVMFERYYPGLVLYCKFKFPKRQDTEDMASEIMNFLFDSIKDFTYKEIGKCQGWLQTFGFRNLREIDNKNKKTVMIRYDDWIKEEKWEDIKMESNEGALLLERKLVALAVFHDLLPAKWITVIKLRIKEGKTWDEVAEIMGGKAKTWSKAYFLLLVKLKKKCMELKLFSE
jgi:DNA-directed RNA polymerase specialized sigma24 family protein